MLTFGSARAVSRKFVTRRRTDHSAVEQRIEKVLLQLEGGSAELHFEQETATRHIQPTLVANNRSQAFQKQPEAAARLLLKFLSPQIQKHKQRKPGI